MGEALFYYFQTFFSSGSYYYYFLTGFGLTAILGLAITFNIGFKNIFKLFQILKIFIFFIFKMISKGKLRLIFQIILKLQGIQIQASLKKPL